MHIIKRSGLRGIWIVLLITLWIPASASGITPKQEEELSREFIKVALKHFQFIEDVLLVDYVNQVGHNIVSVLPPQPFSYRFYIIKADVYNAFAIPAGHIFINSGLLAAMENEDELAGILAHEIAHVVSRHISDKIKRSKKIAAATIAGLVAGVFLGVGGSTEAAQAVTSGALAAGQSMSLAYSREDERQADQLGLRYLAKAGYSGRGLLSMMKKIRSKQWYDSTQFPDYLSTHPGSEERMGVIDSWLEQNSGKPVSAPPKKTYAFTRAHTRLVAQYGDEDSAFQRFKMEVEKNPEDPMAHYGYGLILARKGSLDLAVKQLQKALEKRAFDPFILNDLGRVYFLSGQYQEAARSLEGTVSLAPDNYEALFLLGRTQVELGEFKAARASFEHLMAVRPKYPRASYFLGKTYGRLGQLDQAHYFLGIYYKERGDRKNALFHLKRALTLMNDPRKKEQIETMLREIRKEKKKAENTKEKRG